MFTSVLNFVAASRFIYSFARDGGFPPPFSRYLATVHPKTGAPLYAILLFLTGTVLFAIAWTNESPVVSFNAVSGINSIGFLMVYGTPSLLRFTTALKTFKPSAGFNLGRLSIPIAVLGAAYGAFSVATISLPNFWPVKGHPNNANYAPIAFGAVLVRTNTLFELFAPAADGLTDTSVLLRRRFLLLFTQWRRAASSGSTRAPRLSRRPRASRRP